MRKNGAVVSLLALFLALSGALCVRAATVTLPEGTRIRLQLNETLSTAANLEGDEFTAVVSSPVTLDDKIIIPKGSVVRGRVSRILRPGRLKGKTVLDLLFQSIKIPGRPESDITATLLWIDPEENDGAKVDNPPEQVRAAGTTNLSVSPAGTVPRITIRPFTASGAGGIGDINVRGGPSGRLPSIFSAKGTDLEIHRGAVMDIQLGRALSLPAAVEASE